VIFNPPVDQTVLEQSEVVFRCEAQANPGNLSITWFKGNKQVKSIDEGALSGRSTIKSGDIPTGYQGCIFRGYRKAQIVEVYSTRSNGNDTMIFCPIQVCPIKFA